MRKIALLIFVSCLFIGCASRNPNVNVLNSMQPGLDRDALSMQLGDATPISTDLIDGHYLVKYDLSRTETMRWEQILPYYFVFDQEGHLIGWEEAKGQDKIVVSGVSLLIPFPSRQ